MAQKHIEKERQPWTKETIVSPHWFKVPDPGPCCQVQKKLKENSGPAGDQQSWKKRVAEFVKTRDDENMNTRRRRLRDKSSVEPVRVATMQWMLDINHSMHWLGSSRSDFFVSEDDMFRV